MKLVRGILLCLALCLAVVGAPAQAVAPATAQQAAPSAPTAGKDWEVLQSWKNGVVRGCRTEWDGDNFALTIQLVNRATKGTRGALLGVRSDDFPEWSTMPTEPIAAGTRQTMLETDSTNRPRTIDVRAKITRGDKRSKWGKVVRLDRLNVC